MDKPRRHDELEIGYSTLFYESLQSFRCTMGGIIGAIEQTGTWKIDARFRRNS